MGAWKARKRDGPSNHVPPVSHLDSKRQPPLRKGIEIFLHHKKERFNTNNLASYEKSISELYRNNLRVRVSSLETKQTGSEDKLSNPDENYKMDHIQRTTYIQRQSALARYPSSIALSCAPRAIVIS